MNKVIEETIKCATDKGYQFVLESDSKLLFVKTGPVKPHGPYFAVAMLSSRMAREIVSRGVLDANITWHYTDSLATPEAATQATLNDTHPISQPSAEAIRERDALWRWICQNAQHAKDCAFFTGKSHRCTCALGHLVGADMNQLWELQDAWVNEPVKNPQAWAFRRQKSKASSEIYDRERA